MRLLLVEDSPRLRDLVSETIHEAGWQIDAFATAGEARLALRETDYDLILLDLGLPDEDGLDLLRSLRKAGNAIPILVVTARGAVDERIAGLDGGADDYLTKPFNNGELLARIRALLRRPPVAASPELSFGALVIDVASGAVHARGAEVALAPGERALLELLLRNAGRVVPKRRIENSLSEFGDEKSSNAVELILSRLRRKLGGVDAGVSIETVRGVGYLMRKVDAE